MIIALPPSMHANDEADKALEIGSLEELVNLELDREYQSIPSSRFEEAIVSQSPQKMDLPLPAKSAHISRLCVKLPRTSIRHLQGLFL